MTTYYLLVDCLGPRTEVLQAASLLVPLSPEDLETGEEDTTYRDLLVSRRGRDNFTLEMEINEVHAVAAGKILRKK